MKTQERAVARVEPPGRGVAHTFDCRITMAVDVILELVRRAQISVVLVQAIGLAAETADALEPGNELIFPLRLGAVELRLGRPVLCQSRDFVGYNLLDLRERRSGARGSPDNELPGQFRSN